MNSTKLVRRQSVKKQRNCSLFLYVDLESLCKQGEMMHAIRHANTMMSNVIFQREFFFEFFFQGFPISARALTALIEVHSKEGYAEEADSLFRFFFRVGIFFCWFLVSSFQQAIVERQRANRGIGQARQGCHGQRLIKRIRLEGIIVVGLKWTPNALNNF